MPILSIINQPATNSINAAYRPVVLTVRATATDGGPRPPVVYCDIYFNNLFYKTLSKSQFTALNVSDSDWQFDIQDAAQEYLRSFLAENGGYFITNAAVMIASTYCMFRSSGINSNGFIQSDGVAPIQSTGSTAAVSGLGTNSNTFIVVNSTLQNEDNQDMNLHLAAFKTGTWAANYFPLTHRPNVYKLTTADSDYFPVLLLAGATTFTKLRLNYTFTGQTTVRQTTSNIIPVSLTSAVLIVPNGIKNIDSIFPLINFSQVSEYFIEGLSNSDVVLFTTTLNHVSKHCDDTIRVHFVNYLGTIDAINFKLQTKEHEPKSSQWENSLKYPLDNHLHGINRSNIKSNSTYKVSSTDYSESHMDWIEELFDSGKAWMEWIGTQGQADSYIPIVISDQNFTPRKVDDRYFYELTLEFKLSHDKILIRN